MLKIAAVQFNSVLGEEENNLDKIKQWTKRAADDNCNMVLFGELSITGHFCHNDVAEFAQEVPCGESVKYLMDLAKVNSINICAGIAERCEGKIYNTQFIVSPAGYVGKQRKIHLSGDENVYFEPGDEVSVYCIDGVKYSMLICFDTFFFELSRIMSCKGAEVILNPHASRFGSWQEEKLAWHAESNMIFIKKILPYIAFSNSCYVVFCNQAGQAAGKYDIDVNHAGGLAIFDFNAELIGEFSSSDLTEGILVREVDIHTLKSKRAKNATYISRLRQDIYLKNDPYFQNSRKGDLECMQE